MSGPLRILPSTYDVTGEVFCLSNEQCDEDEMEKLRDKIQGKIIMSHIKSTANGECNPTPKERARLLSKYGALGMIYSEQILGVSQIQQYLQLLTTTI